MASSYNNNCCECKVYGNTFYWEEMKKKIVLLMDTYFLFHRYTVKRSTEMPTGSVK